MPKQIEFTDEEIALLQKIYLWWLDKSCFNFTDIPPDTRIGYKIGLDFDKTVSCEDSDA